MKQITTKSTVLCILVFSIFQLAVSQGAKQYKGDVNYDKFSYLDAIENYEKAVEKGLADETTYKNLANANYLNANYEEAAKWYGELINLEGSSPEPEDYYRYAQCLKSLQQYAESDKWMETFIRISRVDGRAARFTQNRNYLEVIEANSGNFDVSLAEFNSKASDFAPSFGKDGVVFSSARDTGRIVKNIHKWNKSPFLNLYVAKIAEDSTLTDVDKLSRKLNSKAHESSTVFTKDGKTMYFTRNNFDKKFGRDDQGVSRLKIFRAEMVDGDWDNIQELPFNGTNFSTAHPTLNKEEDKLFFASDMPGTFGASDIYYVDIYKDGSYGLPINLGADINTEGRETFPFISENNTLYFASDGHPGLGGLDVFATQINKGTSSEIRNLARPINTDEDDFAFIIDEEAKEGFFTSNRKDGIGDDDIYQFVMKERLEIECNREISGVVRDKNSMDVLANANVQIFNNLGAVVATAVTGPTR